MTGTLQAELIAGSLGLLILILYMLKKQLLTVKYALLWLLLSAVLLVFAAVPYIVYVLRDLLSVEVPVNLVFALLFCFVLALLLSLSIAVSQLAGKTKRLAQENALLEKRVRELEERSADKAQPQEGA